MSGEFGLLGRQMQLAASVLLLLYFAALVLVMPRELRFLRSAEPKYRTRFVFLDVLLQLCILLVLLPCVFSAKLNERSILLVLGGFTGLWLVVLALAYLRYIYTYRILLMSNLDQLRKAQAALEQRTTALEEGRQAAVAPEAAADKREDSA